MREWMFGFVKERERRKEVFFLLDIFSLRHLKNLRESPLLNFLFVFACKNLISLYCVLRGCTVCPLDASSLESHAPLLCFLDPFHHRHNGTHAKKTSSFLCVFVEQEKKPSRLKNPNPNEN